MSPFADDSFPEWNLFGAGKLMKLQRIRPDWPVRHLGHEALKGQHAMHHHVCL